MVEGVSPTQPMTGHLPTSRSSHRMRSGTTTAALHQYPGPPESSSSPLLHGARPPQGSSWGCLPSRPRPSGAWLEQSQGGTRYRRQLRGCQELLELLELLLVLLQEVSLLLGQADAGNDTQTMRRDRETRLPPAAHKSRTLRPRCREAGMCSVRGPRETD